jgi:hypothetical protein
MKCDCHKYENMPDCLVIGDALNQKEDNPGRLNRAASEQQLQINSSH